ncbi:MAG: dihydrofolate reductase [Bacteroidales bacterium]|jgi:dihydrofolate reductase|nr:dihydrofolate reductase [Bacteroidales bacterium]MCI2121947.1 dihydrofolate reductase [Bacteroidales bacterium]MCI2144984.1 dihydrofolate reductase [Bacteroidales bacterium]
MSISLIAAIGRNNVIGRDGGMPWHISEDLKHFKKITVGHTVVMGRRTWESLGCKPLPNRRNIVISGSMPLASGIEVRHDAGFLEQYRGNSCEEEIFIIGGGQLYGKTIGIADKLYITETDIPIEGADTFFPKIDLKEWDCVSNSGPIIDGKSGSTVVFKEYERHRQH